MQLEHLTMIRTNITSTELIRKGWNTEAEMHEAIKLHAAITKLDYMIFDLRRELDPNPPAKFTEW